MPSPNDQENEMMLQNENYSHIKILGLENRFVGKWKKKGKQTDLGTKRMPLKKDNLSQNLDVLLFCPKNPEPTIPTFF